MTERVSVATGGSEQNGDAYYPSVSADGRFVAFASAATNLVPGDSNGAFDVFVHDRLTGATTRASVASDGSQADSDSVLSVISANGRYIALESNASNLVSGDTNHESDIFVHDLQTGQTTRVSLLADGTQRIRRSFGVDISDDGRFVAFTASHESEADPAGVYVHDRVTGDTTHVSRYSDGSPDEYSFSPAISGDGRYVAFASGQPLVPGDTNNQQDIFVRDRQTQQTTRISTATGGSEANGPSEKPDISANGQLVAFQSFATNLVTGDTNGVYDMFVHDRQTGVTKRVSVASDGTQANFPGGTESFRPSLSRTGRFVAFASGSSNLVPSDTNGNGDVFVHDLQTGATERVSVASGGTQANGESAQGVLNADGQFVAFRSDASNLVSADTNGRADIFVNDRGPIVPAAPASLTLDPPADTNPVDTTHTVTATVRDANGQPSAAVTVRFAVAGSITTSGSCVTTANGTCSFSYSGPSLPGADAITAYADTNGDGSKQPDEPSGEAVKAWLAPASTPGQVSGGGQVENAADDPAIAFGFTAKSDAQGMKGECTVVDITPVKNVKVKCTSVTSMTISGTHASIFGAATLNGAATTYRIDVDDLAEPGRNRDTFRIQLATGYAASGTLTGGNIQIHQ
jgi:Tol biopolymer transport system component